MGDRADRMELERGLMRQCLQLAARGAGHVSPNPMVGAVLADRSGRILAAGYHRVFGGPHAEVRCLDGYRGSMAGTTLFVNLEPCAHEGKTPPCVDRILRARVPRVVVAMRDPNPRVSGRGIAALRRAGVAVEVGLCAAEAQELNRAFVRHITAGRPYVHLKIAESLDGRIAAGAGRRTTISSAASQRLVHRWRALHDAVLVGAGTIAADDPRLTVRLVHGRNPDVVILDGGLRLGPEARVFSDTRARRVFLFTRGTRQPRRRSVLRRLALMGVIVMEMPVRSGEIPLRAILASLYSHNIGSVLVEGGRDVFTRFAAEGLVDELSLFVAPRLLPGGLPAFGEGASGPVRRPKARAVQVCLSGGDVLVNTRW